MANPLPPVDRTPASVLKKMADSEAAYPKQDCNECGAVSYTHLTLPTNREV